MIPNPGVPQTCLFICVNYHSDSDTISLLENLKSLNETASVDILVADNTIRANDSRPFSVEHVHPRARVASSHKNLGYFGGARWAFEEYLKETPLPTWVIVSNTDIFFEDKDFFKTLFSLYPEKAPAVLAPRIYSDLTGIDQNPHMLRRPSAKEMHKYSLIFRTYPGLAAYHALHLCKKKCQNLARLLFSRNSRSNKSSTSIAQQIYAPHGSFMIFHKSYFEAGGNFEHGAFLFGEEIFVAESTRRLGLRVVYEPRLSIVHREHATTGWIPNRKMADFIRDANLYTISTFFSR